MAVYVDDFNYPKKMGRTTFVFSHMTADTVEELHVMADKIGLKREWFQGKSVPHYDVSKSKRLLAIQHGAIPETVKEGVRRRMQARRQG